MTRDEIYNHLAQVYLGKRNKSEYKRRKQFNAWLVINGVITAVIFISAFYGLTAFLTKRGEFLQSRVIFALNNGPIRIKYDVNEPYPSSKTFSLSISKFDSDKYEKLSFLIRGLEEGVPGIVKITVRNKRNETSSYFINNVKLDWQKFDIPFSEFKGITDWSSLTDVSFVFEAWNVENKRGIVLIDDVCFSG
ncbi:MAG: hypothetical protein WC552_00090 [Candidatus Omnitrophota bacterium]